MVSHSGYRKGIGIPAATVDARRAIVSACTTRGMTLREICRFMEAQRETRGEEGAETNPVTHKVWNLSTVAQDVRFLRQHWQHVAEGEMKSARADVLARVREIQKQCWKDHKPLGVLAALETEMRILGIGSAQKVDVVVRVKEYARELGFSDEQVAEAVREAERLVGVKS
jgi:DNA-binding transcriptional MerR regulator